MKRDPAERLPVAKDLAAVLGVNKNTVLRALHILRDEGLLDFQRGRGMIVAGTAQRGIVVGRVRELIEFCRRPPAQKHKPLQPVPGYDTEPLSTFEPVVRRVLARPWAPAGPSGPEAPSGG